MVDTLRAPSQRMNPSFCSVLSLINAENAPFRFLILDCPTDSRLPDYLEEFQRLNVTDVVRVCEPTYKTDLLFKVGIAIHDWPFKDGEAPTQVVLKKWLDLVDERLKDAKKNPDVDENNPDTFPTIAVHCVAGLGRAPVLVAVALIELGMEKMDAALLIRTKRRGAINNRQLLFLESYKRTMRLRGNKTPNSFRVSLGKMFRSKAALAH